MGQWDPTFRKLEGPVTDRFDCGEKDQNEFLLQRAWREQQDGWSFTHLAYVGGMLAGYVTLANDAIELSVDERLESTPSATVPALKVAQFAVDKRFQGHRVGEKLLVLALWHAQQTSQGTALGAGCRLLTLDCL